MNRTTLALFLSVTFATPAFATDFMWCPGKKLAVGVAKSLKQSDFARGRLTGEKVKAITPGCGIGDGKLLKRDRNKKISFIGDAKTADGKTVPMFKGVGGRVLIPADKSLY